MLVLSEWQSPNWQAKLNGQSELIETANYAFQAMILPAGTHEVRFLYMPKDVYSGIFLALLTLVIALFLAWKWRPQIETRSKQINWHSYQLQLQFSAGNRQKMGRQIRIVLLIAWS